jgi:hypothetical protein
MDSEKQGDRNVDGGTKSVVGCSADEKGGGSR